jgi:SAM-dependent methyltransferase
MTELYDDDLAFIHAEGFGELAAAAAAVIIPRLEARGANRVIDVGCGAGVTTKALVDAGFETTAIEPSEALLERARRAALGARFQQGSVYDLQLPACDAILAIGEALTYHAPSVDAEARLRGFFANASQALPRGGLLIFDLIETGSSALDGRTWMAGPTWAVLANSHEDVGARELTRQIETFRDTGGGSYRRRSEIHHVRVFERKTVTSWLEQLGFEVETATAYGSYELPRRRVAFYASRR